MATSPIAASRLVARNVSQSGYAAIQSKFEDWIAARSDSAIASDALVGALGFSKDPDKVLAEARRIYNAAVANGEDPGSGLSQPAVEAIVDAKTSQMGSKFRGDWSAGELTWSDDLSSALNPLYWALGGGAQVAAITTTGGANRPAYSNIIHCGGGGTATLDISKIPALAGKTVVSIKFWHSIYRYIGGANTLQQGGVEKWSRSVSADSTAPYEQENVSLSPTGSLVWAGNGSDAFLTGFEIYTAANPYKLGEFALYVGKMWKSTVNNNSSVPGQSGTWQEVPVNFNQIYTTGTRPSAVTAGAGAQIYDGTLHKPIWSDGAVWRDAGGTAV